jgi:hypothetical protein
MRTFRNLVIAGWAVYFVTAAALVAFPRVLVRTVTPAKLLALSIVVIAASCVYSMLAVIRVVRRRLHKSSRPAGLARGSRFSEKWDRILPAHCLFRHLSLYKQVNPWYNAL